MRVDLDVPRRSRVHHAVTAVGFAVVGTLVLGVALFDAEASFAWRLGAAFCGVGTLWLALVGGRLAAARPGIEVETGRLVVDHPGLLKRPLVIERDAVVAVLFDDPGEREGGAPHRPTGARAIVRRLLPRLFVLRGDEEASLYPGGLQFMPMIGGRLQLPDVAILARAPIPIGSVSRIMAASMTDNQGLRDTGATWGVFIRTADSASLRAALSSWSVDRVPTVAELEALQPLYERRRPLWRRPG